METIVAADINFPADVRAIPDVIGWARAATGPHFLGPDYVVFSRFRGAAATVLGATKPEGRPSDCGAWAAFGGAPGDGDWRLEDDFWGSASERFAAPVDYHLWADTGGRIREVIIVWDKPAGASGGQLGVVAGVDDVESNDDRVFGWHAEFDDTIHLGREVAGAFAENGPVGGQVWDAEGGTRLFRLLYNDSKARWEFWFGGALLQTWASTFGKDNPIAGLLENNYSGERAYEVLMAR